MGDEHRLRGGGDSFGGGAIAAMAKIDGHADFVHFLNGRDSGFAQPGIPRFEAAVPKNAAIVVGELHDPYAEVAKKINPLGVLLQKRCVLKTWKDAELAVPLGAGDIRVFANNSECVRILFHERFERSEVLKRSVKSAF